MERLTYRHKDQNGNPTDCISQQINLKYVPRKDWLEKIAIRLADIEDILGDDYDLDRLRELVEAYRDGRCAPLKPGDIVTCIWYGRPTQNKVERINFYWVDDGIDWYAITTSTTGSKECFGKDEWGKTVFPTYEAAEAALKASNMNETIMMDYLAKMLPELDIEAAVEDGNVMAVQEYGRQVELLAMELYQQKQMDKLEQLVDRQRRCIARCSDILQDTNPIPYEVGRMSGMLELMVQVIRNQHRQVQISTQVAELYQLPHFKEILAAIGSSPGIQHKRLAEKIGVDTITLAWIMERIEQAGFVCFVRSGEYKYYKLTTSVEPVVYGHWEIEEVDWGFCEATGRRHIHKKFKCSVCGYTTGDQAEKFVCCPICTARMGR